MALEGLHHFTPIAGDAPRTVDIYARALGRAARLEGERAAVSRADDGRLTPISNPRRPA